ncbi:hypothetical protein DSM107010_47980 [Chroococcidiopsis cubana SAG 39.79]|uniref:DUF5615 domain-containing protein n=1 Tax=Chroococcidiopsis cubana SAG 39.79 TaxID=388085 RepID=A0AB37UEE3_9CYAN|nr:hypothetical protein C7B79_13420 [Chroococcidiopsis cubana CCALA 043]RUT08653.1 hypothetical protein DSM107010_47980 [Chroococcidiopsis cubana SAG 39.79]
MGNAHLTILTTFDVSAIAFLLEFKERYILMGATTSKPDALTIIDSGLENPAFLRHCKISLNKYL